MIGVGPRALLWALLGAVVGTALDALHVVTGTLTYRQVDFGVQAFWVPPLFAGAGLALGLGHRHVASRFFGPVPPASGTEAVVGVLLLVCTYGSSGLLRHWPWTTALLYVLIFAAGAAWTPRAARPALMLHALGAGLMGPVVEVLISGTGAFTYAAHDVAGVPAWLPGVYLNAAVGTAALDRFLLGWETKRRAATSAA